MVYLNDSTTFFSFRALLSCVRTDVKMGTRFDRRRVLLWRSPGAPDESVYYEDLSPTTYLVIVLVTSTSRGSDDTRSFGIQPLPSTR